MSTRISLRSLLASSFLSAALLACGGGAATAPASSGSTPTAASADPSCPVAVAGTSVTVEDNDTGAALVFVTTGDAAEVRRRVDALAKMHNEHHGAMGPLPDGSASGGGHEGHDMGGTAGHAGQAGHGSSAGEHAGHGASGGAHAGHAGGMIGVHSQASVADATGGARLIFVAGHADVAKLQSELRMHAQHMANGSCEMSK